MRRRLLWLAAAAALATVGVGAAKALVAAETVVTETFTHVVTYTIPTHTETVTVTAAPPTTTTTTTTPPPPANDCTRQLAPTGDLSTFASSLVSGDVGCLRGGDYTDGPTMTWSVSGATLTAFPGEAVRVHTELHLTGSNQTLRGFTISNTATTCNAGASTTGCDGVRISGAGARILGIVIENTDRHGILFHSSASNGQILRSTIRNTGATGTTLEHGIYFQGNGHLVANNVISGQRGGYGIQLYPSSSNVTVAQNTVANTLVRPSIVINTSGTGNRVVNNVFANGINQGACAGCTIDRNLTSSPGFIDGDFRVGATSPAVDAGRSDFSFSPDRDGVLRPQGAGPDIGAYER